MSDLTATSQSGVLECVTFSVGGQIYCLDIMLIREIRRWVPVTPLPHADPQVLGVINLRGSVIPIYDLAVHFGITRTAPSARNVVIVVDVQGSSFGILVESVSEILTVNKSDVQETPRMNRGNQPSLIDGLISVGDDMAQLIDLRQIARQPADVAL